MTNWTHMAALVASLPDLPGAACAGEHAAFDATISGRRITPSGESKLVPRAELESARSEALNVCRACPALEPCRAWLSRLRPSRRPRGVVAGQVVRST